MNYLDKLDKVFAISEADINRRKFLRKLGGAVSAASTFDVNQVVKSMMGISLDPFSHMSDYELMRTPERDWITLIPYSRLLRLVKDPGGYGGHEIMNKAYNVLSYGHLEEQYINIAKILAKAMKDAGVSPKQFADAVAEYAPTMLDVAPQLLPNMQISYADYTVDLVPAASDGLSSKIINFAREVGIEVPDTVIDNTFKSAANRLIDRMSSDRKRRHERGPDKVESKPSAVSYDPYDEFLMGQMAHESGIGESVLRFLAIEDIAGSIE